jgi:hypothetical protein
LIAFDVLFTPFIHRRQVRLFLVSAYDYTLEDFPEDAGGDMSLSIGDSKNNLFDMQAQAEQNDKMVNLEEISGGYDENMIRNVITRVGYDKEADPIAFVQFLAVCMDVILSATVEEPKFIVPYGTGGILSCMEKIEHEEEGDEE